MQSTAQARLETRTALRTASAVLFDWRLGGLIGLWLLLTLVLFQVPLSYSFNIGQLVGPGSDRPFLRGFYPSEGSGATQRIQWSKGDEAYLEVPGVGRRGVVVTLDIASHRAQWISPETPTVLRVQMSDGSVVPITLRQPGAQYQIYVPPHLMNDGVLRLGLHTDAWQREGDSRDELGIALTRQIWIESVPSVGFVLPDRALLFAWPLGLFLLWVTLRMIDFSPRMTWWLLLPIAVGTPLFLLTEAPRLGFTSRWIIQVSALSVVFAALCQWIIPPLLRRFNALPSPTILRWLLFLTVASFALKYGGRLYPESMPGDLQLHVNRYTLTTHGSVYIAAQHRGLPFPFPPAIYLTLAPFALTGIDIRFWFEFSAGLFEASTVVLLYLLMTSAGASPRLGLIAAATYALTAAGFMTTWFAFETQVAAQWFFIALMLALVAGWPHYRSRLLWWGIVLLMIQVFLGHIGLFMNTVLLGLLALPMIWFYLRSREERQGVVRIFWAGFTACLFVGLFYYTGFMNMIVEQVVGVATVGLNEVTERTPTPRAESLEAVWQDGLITHFGFFPVLLMIPGTILLIRGKLGRSILPWLVFSSVLVSVSQGILPFITLSTITTRWLMFSAWAVAVVGALGFWMLWQRGRSARVIVIAMASYVCWIAMMIWLEAMTLRQPPVEPF